MRKVERTPRVDLFFLIFRSILSILSARSHSRNLPGGSEIARDIYRDRDLNLLEASTDFHRHPLSPTRCVFLTQPLAFPLHARPHFPSLR